VVAGEAPHFDAGLCVERALVQLVALNAAAQVAVKAKLESSVSYFIFKFLVVPGAFEVGFIGASYTAISRSRSCSAAPPPSRGARA